MKRYPIRAAKYALYLCILFFIIFGIMRAVGYSRIVTLQDITMSSQGLMMLGVIVLFALLHPFTGYTTRSLTFNAEKRAEDVERVMAMCGFRRVAGDTPEAMVFEAANWSKKLLLRYEDRITIDTVDGASRISGNRKEVVRAYYRMGTYIA